MSEQVREMFSAIAPRYDVVNELLSFGIHKGWRRTTVRAAEVKPGMSVLDCASGTGDLALAFKRAVGAGGDVVGTDFCADMLARAPAKAESAGLDVRFEVADVLQLPYPDARFDRASIAFGIRNVDDPVQALRELRRVVKPGGKVLVLEFGQPTGFFGTLYRFYSRYVMPLVGGLVSGNRAAYQYLPRTAAAFPAGDAFLHLMEQAGGFKTRTALPLTFATAFVYVGEVA